MDALSFHAAGIENAVAPLGTAFTTKQAQTIRRRAERVLLCFDSDDAGKKAAERACSIATEAGLETFVVLMTEGKDASEILEKFGADALKKVPECCINSGDFLIRRSEELFDLGTMEGKSKASLFFYPYLDALDSEVKRNGFFDIVGRRIGGKPFRPSNRLSKSQDNRGQPGGQFGKGWSRAFRREVRRRQDGRPFFHGGSRP